MPEQGSRLESVLWQIIERDHADEETGELSEKESQRVQRSIRDYLEISDSPSSRIPGEIADFVCWNCSSGSQSAVERWLNSLREEELDNLMLGDVLGLLRPGLENDIERLAIENEEEKPSR